VSASTSERPTASLRLITVMLAFGCGATVANLYYAQPLLALIARSFSISQGTAAIVDTATQVGYALGLAFVLPTGDLVENRTLASRTLLVTALALGGAAAAPGFAAFLALSVLIGISSVVAQILVPFAAHLAPEAERGRFVGTVMSGLLLGILLARTVSSLAAAAWGWRSIYAISAGLMVATSLALRRVLPRRAPEHVSSYPRLLASVGALVRDEPLLRRLALRQACMFGAFTAFWTAIAFVLTDRHHFDQAQIGLFALVGAAGAAAAPLAGRLGDRGYGRIGGGATLLLGLLAMLAAGFSAGSVVALAVAGVLLDLAVQGHQVLSQREIYALRPDARARINSVYMGTVFVGGSIASAVTGVVFDAEGWRAVTLFAGALPLVGLGLWARDARREVR
jgi:predicted MFS family arabinose efflux permease